MSFHRRLSLALLEGVWNEVERRPTGWRVYTAVVGRLECTVKEVWPHGGILLHGFRILAEDPVGWQGY